MWMVFLVLLCVFCGYVTRRDMGDAGSQQHVEIRVAQRVPGLQAVLQSRARKFDPAKDIEINECAICLAYFSVDDPQDLVELGCNDKHVFHYACLETWF